MKKTEMIAVLRQIQTFLENSTSCLTEEDSQYAPKAGMLTGGGYGGIRLSLQAAP